MGLLSERPKYRCRLFTGVCDCQAEHPGFVLGVKAQVRRRHDQPSRALPFDQARNQPLLSLLDRFVADASFGQQRTDQIRREIRSHSRRLVDDEMAMH